MVKLKRYHPALITILIAVLIVVPQILAQSLWQREDNTTLQGATTLRYFGTNDLAQCENSCGADAQCKAYTFVKRGAFASNPNNGVCYLSSSFREKVSSQCCVSGVRSDTASNQNLILLKLFWSAARGDNFTTATTQGEQDARSAGYAYVRAEGYIFRNQQPGTVPLKLYWSALRGDNLTTATAQGEQFAQRAGYTYVRVEGYIYQAQQPGTYPLKNYWSDARADCFSTATAEGDWAAQQAQYRYTGIEGYVFPTSIITTTSTVAGTVSGTWHLTSPFNRGWQATITLNEGVNGALSGTVQDDPLNTEIKPDAAEWGSGPSVKSVHSGSSLTLVLRPSGWLSTLELTGQLNANGTQIDGKLHHSSSDDTTFTMVRR